MVIHCGGRKYSMRIHVISSRLTLFSLLGLLLLLAACGQSTTQGTTSTLTPTPTTAVDAYGTPIVMPKTAPQRIISLAPSISETLAALNLQNKVVGVDYYTNYPASMAAKKKVSDANGDYNVEAIVALKPDLILSSGGITKDIDAQLARVGLHVVDLPTANFSQVLQQIQLIGQLTYAQSAAQTVVSQLQQQITSVQNAVKGTNSPSVMLEVDDSTPGKPYVFGGGSFGDQLLQYAHATNIFHANATNSGYPQVTDEAVIHDNPQYIILTEDPQYGGNPSAVYKRTGWSVISAVKTHQVYRLNADIMQRPGPRLGEALRCVAQIVHPDKFSGALPSYCTGTV